MSKKSRTIAELENRLATTEVQLTVAERLLGDRESVLDLYRSSYADLVRSLDNLTGVVNKKLAVASTVKKAPAKRASK